MYHTEVVTAGDACGHALAMLVQDVRYLLLRVVSIKK